MGGLWLWLCISGARPRVLGPDAHQPGNPKRPLPPPLRNMNATAPALWLENDSLKAPLHFHLLQLIANYLMCVCCFNLHLLTTRGVFVGSHPKTGSLDLRAASRRLRHSALGGGAGPGSHPGAPSEAGRRFDPGASCLCLFLRLVWLAVDGLIAFTRENHRFSTKRSPRTKHFEQNGPPFGWVFNLEPTGDPYFFADPYFREDYFREVVWLQPGRLGKTPTPPVPGVTGTLAEGAPSLLSRAVWGRSSRGELTDE